MIPIADSVQTRRTPWVNLGLLSTIALVFLFELLLGPSRDLLIVRWGAVPSRILAALGGDPRVSPLALLTLVTSQFLHGGWLHVGSNMLFLWVFGRAVEDRLGHLRYLCFYLLWGVGAALAQIWMTGPSPVPLIGASGAIAGVLGAYTVLYPTAWVSLLVPILFFFWVIDVPALLVLAYWFAVQFLNGLASITPVSGGGVAFWAHVGGFVLGLLSAPLFPAPVAGPKRAARSGAARPWQAGSPLAGLISSVADLLVLLLMVRLALRLLGVVPRGELAWLIRLVYEWSWLLVRPFAEVLPSLIVDGRVLELATLVAVLAYASAASLAIWLLDAALRRGTPAR